MTQHAAARHRLFLVVESAFIPFFARLSIFALLDWRGMVPCDGFKPPRMVVPSGVLLLNAIGAMIVGRPAPGCTATVIDLP